MFSSVSQCALAFALVINIEYVKGIMVRSVDGSFVPWSFAARAPGDGLAVQMTNNHDLAYLVSSHRFTCVPSTDEVMVIGNCPNGLVFVAVSLLGFGSIIMLCDRHSCSADPNGCFSFARPYLSGNSSGRCQRPIIVRMIVNQTSNHCR